MVLVLQDTVRLLASNETKRSPSPQSHQSGMLGPDHWQACLRGNPCLVRYTYGPRFEWDNMPLDHSGSPELAELAELFGISFTNTYNIAPWFHKTFCAGHVCRFRCSTTWRLQTCGNCSLGMARLQPHLRDTRAGKQRPQWRSGPMLCEDWQICVVFAFTLLISRDEFTFTEIYTWKTMFVILAVFRLPVAVSLLPNCNFLSTHCN